MVLNFRILFLVGYPNPNVSLCMFYCFQALLRIYIKYITKKNTIEDKRFVLVIFGGVAILKNVLCFYVPTNFNLI